jgi:hypothetical protein
MTDVRGQMSEDRCQRSDVRGQRSDVKRQTAFEYGFWISECGSPKKEKVRVGMLEHGA